MPGYTYKLRVIRVVYQGRGKAFSLDNIPDLTEWLEEQVSVVNDHAAERGRAKFYYTHSGDIYPVSYG